MEQLDVSHETAQFEVRAELDENECLSQECSRRICELIDEHGFAIVQGLLSDEDAAAGLEIVKKVVADPMRERSSFASQTDVRYHRRDFCPLPSSQEVLSYCSLLARRLRGVLTEYCGSTRLVLEVSTLTSYLGSSHQYLHRDPPGVLCVFAALDDVSPEQGGTVFTPGTHPFTGSRHGFRGKADLLMHLFQIQCNVRILRYNIQKLIRMRKSGAAGVTRQEFWDRVLSPKTTDSHQPNLYRFLTGNSVFALSKFTPGTLLNLVRHGKAAAETFRLVQASPKRGTLLVYRSDILHAGPDNRSDKPRYFLNINLSRDLMHPKVWRDAYSPHSSLLAQPTTLGHLLDGHGAGGKSGAGSART